MEMTGDAGPRFLAEIHPEIQGLRLERLLDKAHGGSGEFKELTRLFRREFVETAEVAIRDDQGVAGIVGKFVENDEIPLTAVNDQILQGVRHAEPPTEDAPFFFLVEHEGGAPGGPDNLLGHSH